jgi:hypothetical protein
MPRRLGKRFLKEAERILAAKASMSEVTPIRHTSTFVAMAKARHLARLSHVTRLPVFLARLAKR